MKVLQNVLALIQNTHYNDTKKVEKIISLIEENPPLKNLDFAQVDYEKGYPEMFNTYADSSTGELLQDQQSVGFEYKDGENYRLVLFKGVENRG